MPEMELEPSLKKPPVSRLQLIQAQFQRKLLLEKEERMMQMYPPEPPQRSTRGGAVREFFAQRRAQHGVADAAKAKDPLSSSNGLISLQQSMNGGSSFQTGTFSRSTNGANKHGSPVGWDKSYPLSPLDRDGSSSSSGYDSFNSTFSTASPHNNSNSRNSYGNKATAAGAAAATTRRAPAVGARRNLAPPAAARRAPSLDRRPRNDPSGSNNYANGLGGMRRSNSQVLNNNGRNFDEDEGFVPFSRTRKNPPNKLDVPKISPASRKSRPSNQPSNVTYKVPSPGHDYVLDDSNAKGRRPVVPAIGQLRGRTQAPPATTNKKAPSRAPVGRASTADPNLVQCHMCGRNFAPDRIEKHETICEKANTKKRKVFDPTKMRIKGTDLEDFQRQSGKLGGGGGRNKQADAPEPKKSDWRQKRNNFIETLRQAKMVQRHVAAGGRASDLPPPPPMDTSDYVQCPHCGRKFSEGAAERHVPKCMNIKSNKNSDVRR